MKSVGIITFHESINYGALLQAYALRRFLCLNGYDTVIIDYQNKKRKYGAVKGWKRIRSFFWTHTFYRLLRSRKREENTANFRKLYFSYSKRYSSHEEIIKSPPKFDYYITGSDQVWNKRNNNGDTCYFLDFVPGSECKISYAPSFGTANLNEDYARTCKKWISRFDYVSVREKSGADIIERLCGFRPPVVCDPVFLLDKSDWETIEHSSYTFPPFILCYYMPGDKLVVRKIREISNRLHQMTGLPIISLGKKIYDIWPDGSKNIFSAGPSEFIALIHSAEFVVTNSFHGTAFSILYHKKVWVPYNDLLNKDQALHTRILELLSDCGLSHRAIVCPSDLSKIDLEETIDYSVVERRLDVIRANSKNFLLCAISGGVR